MKNFSISSLLILLMLGCSADPTAFKLPVPEKKFVKTQGSISTYNPEVDILFIIDDSGSMQTYQSRLAANTDLFINEFFNAKFIDYHIGATTSTEDGPIWGGGSVAPGGKLHRVNGVSFVDRNTVSGSALLTEILSVGDNGSGTEKFLSIPELTFSEELQKGFNKGFFRENAHLLIFVLTDTGDQSDVSAQAAYDYLLKLKNGDESKLHFAGAFVTIETEKCTGEMESKKLTKFKEFIKLFQGRGFRFNICQKNYGQELAEVAKDVVNAVSTVFLDNLPDVRTMQVYYGDQLIPNQESGGWTYDYNLNAIHLSPDIDVQPGVSQKLSIRYEQIYKPEPVKQ